MEIISRIREKLNHNELTRQEQIAFQNLANALIFNEKTNIPLSKKNIPKIVEKIEQEYLHIDFTFAKKSEEGLRKMYGQIQSANQQINKESGENGSKNSLEEELSKPELSFEKYMKDFKISQPITYEKISTFVNKTLAIRANGGIVDYGEWGFTPKLALLKQSSNNGEKDVFNYFINKNCFGITSTIAAYFGYNKIPFKFAMSSNHPFLVLDLEGKKYIVSSYGMLEFKNYQTNQNGILAELTREKVVGEIVYTLLLSCNYEEGLVYELLENFEALRQLALGNDITTLAGTYKPGMAIVEKHKDVLLAANWSKVQSKLFPEITKYFADNRAKWDEENGKLEDHYLYHTMARKLMSIFTEALKETSFKDLKFKDAQKKIKEKITPYVPQILDTLENLTDLPTDMDEDASKYIRYVLNEISKIAIENNQENPREFDMISVILAGKLKELGSNSWEEQFEESLDSDLN